MTCRNIAILALGLILTATGCDLGTYGSRVADREAILRDPSLAPQKEEVDTTSDYQYYHLIYADYYSTNQRLPGKWEDIYNYAQGWGPRGPNAAAAIQRLANEGYSPNWNVDLNAASLDGQPILYKPNNGGIKILFNGTIIP